MGHIMIPVNITLLSQDLGVVFQPLSVVLVIVDEAYFSAYALDEPDSHGIIHTQIPEGIDLEATFSGDRANPSFLSGISDLFTPIGTGIKSLKAIKIF